MSIKDILSQDMKTQDYINSIANNYDWFPVKTNVSPRSHPVQKVNPPETKALRLALTRHYWVKVQGFGFTDFISKRAPSATRPPLH